MPLVVFTFYLRRAAGAVGRLPLIFSLAGITDWLDGQLARAWSSNRSWAASSIPIADKLLVATTLFMLAATQRISGWPSCRRSSSCAREILVSGLREHLAGARERAGLAARQMEDGDPDGRDRRAAGRRCRARVLPAKFLGEACCGSPPRLRWSPATNISTPASSMMQCEAVQPAIKAAQAERRDQAVSGPAMRVFGLAGWSGSGKTTLLIRLLPALLARGSRVSTMKHAHHAFDIDQPGKDSYRHREAGATEVMISSSQRWALMHELRGAAEPPLAELLAHMAPVDLVLVEGFKRAAHPEARNPSRRRRQAAALRPRTATSSRSPRTCRSPASAAAAPRARRCRRDRRFHHRSLPIAGGRGAAQRRLLRLRRRADVGRRGAGAARRSSRRSPKPRPWR